MDDDQQDFDNVVWDINDEAWGKTGKRLCTKMTCLAIESVAADKCGKRATLVPPLRAGGYNMIYRIRLEELSTNDGIVFRISRPDLTQFPEEKTIAEVATVKYIKENTNIPTPHVYHYGSSSLDTEIGPYIIMSYIKNNGSFSAALNDPKIKPGEPHMLDLNAEEEKLEHLYGQMAGHPLELS
ncbi:hypothetical protein G7Y89_g9823 [Cudoniella acicularis]|uniref:Uncharacterized protein n=1 Tax=Cudoniella acicularis TaxID=354080 RepID=A0A8H4RGQ0_9HELO|nr:hypothetical protein G7Y89_g9823 [Cudoniella acicularis]